MDASFSIVASVTPPPGLLQRAAAGRGGCGRCSGWSPRLAGRQGFEPRLTPRSSQAGRLPLLQTRHAPPGHLDKSAPAHQRPMRLDPPRQTDGVGPRARHSCVRASPHRPTAAEVVTTNRTIPRSPQTRSLIQATAIPIPTPNSPPDQPQAYNPHTRWNPRFGPTRCLCRRASLAHVPPTRARAPATQPYSLGRLLQSPASLSAPPYLCPLRRSRKNETRRQSHLTGGS